MGCGSSKVEPQKAKDLEIAFKVQIKVIDAQIIEAAITQRFSFVFHELPEFLVPKLELYYRNRGYSSRSDGRSLFIGWEIINK